MKRILTLLFIVIVTAKFSSAQTLYKEKKSSNTDSLSSININKIVFEDYTKRKSLPVFDYKPLSLKTRKFSKIYVNNSSFQNEINDITTLPSKKKTYPLLSY